jgi:hypothetical protein
MEVNAATGKDSPARGTDRKQLDRLMDAAIAAAIKAP